MLGCDDPAPPPVAVSIAIPAPRDRARERIAQARTAIAGEEPAGIDLAREAARLALELGAADPLVDDARGVLEQAAATDQPGSCEAALDLARLDADARHAPREAYATAYRLVRRFRGEDDSSCVREGRVLVAMLSSHRPPEEELVAIDRELGVAVEGGETAHVEDVIVHGASGDSEAVRVVVRLDGAAEMTREDDSTSHRVTLRFAGATTSPDLPPALSVGRAGLARVRLSADDEAARVTLDLDEGATADAFVLADPFRAVIDVAAGPPPALAEASRRMRCIVLDAGHGGDDYGTLHQGERESRLVLDVTFRVARILARLMPSTEVLLTRTTDEEMSLEQRTAFANASDADAFVSIHLNAAESTVGHGGVATFVLDETDDRQLTQLAARENGTRASQLTGLDLRLASIHRRQQVDASRALASLVQEHTVLEGREHLPRLADRGVKSAMFYVLVGARMPAVLVEASFLTQPEELEALRTEPYREGLARGIAEGIAEYAVRRSLEGS